MSFEPGAHAQAATESCIPCLRLFAETLFDDDGEEREVAMLRLDFDYGGRRVRANNPRWTGRDRRAEIEACRILESFGAIELATLEGCAVSPSVAVDHIVDGDADAQCAFGAYA